MNMDEEIMRRNGKDSVSLNPRETLSQVVLKDDRTLMFDLKKIYSYAFLLVQAKINSQVLYK